MKLHGFVLFLLISFTVTSCVEGGKSTSKTTNNRTPDADPNQEPTTYYSGDGTYKTLDTSAVVENSRLYFTEDRVRTTDLEGISYLDATRVVASDNVIVAFGKTQKQIDDLITGQSSGGWSTTSGNTFKTTGNVGIGTASPSERLMVSGNALITGSLRLRDSGSNIVSLRAPTTAVSSYDLYFPPFPGTSGQFLMTTGSGQLAWLTIPNCLAGQVLRSDGTTFTCVSDNAGSGSFSGGANTVVMTDGSGGLVSSATVSSTELGYLDGVTSNIQTQLDAKALASAVVNWAISGVQTIDNSRLYFTTANRVLVSNASGNPTTSPISTTEISYLAGVSSNVQSQLNAKVALSSIPTCPVGQVLRYDGTSFSCVVAGSGSTFSGTASRAVATDGTGALTTTTVTATELGYLSGVTSSVQTQLNNKLTTASFPTCGVGQYLRYDGTNFSCVTDNAGSGAFTGTSSRAIATDGAGALTTTAVTATELGYVSGVTSAIQTQLNARVPYSTLPTCAVGQYLRFDGANFSCVADNAGSGTFSGTASRAMATDGAGALTTSSVTATELGYLSGTTSSVQTQLNSKVPLASFPTCGVGQYLRYDGTNFSCVADNAGSGAFTGTASRVVATDGAGALSASSVTATELGYLSGVTSSLQSQINSRVATTSLPTCGVGQYLRYDGTNFSCVTDATGSAIDWSTSGVQTIDNTRLYFTTPNRVLISNGSANAAISSVTSTELGYLSGVTSSLQTQLNAKVPLASFPTCGVGQYLRYDGTNFSCVTDNTGSGAFSGTASRAIATDGAGALTTTAVTATELGYVSGVTSAIQTQLNSKVATSSLPTCGVGQYLRYDGTNFSCVNDASGGTPFSGTANRAVSTDGSGALTSSSVTATELGYLSGVTSSIQTQLNAKAASSSIVDWSVAGVQTIEPTRLFLTTANRALVTNETGTPIVSAVTATELSYLTGVTSSIQTQLNAKITSETDPGVQAFAKSAPPTCNTGEVLKSDGSTLSCVADSESNWILNTSNLYRPVGNVSIGLASGATTEAKLHVEGSITATGSSAEIGVTGGVDTSGTLYVTNNRTQLGEPSSLYLGGGANGTDDPIDGHAMGAVTFGNADGVASAAIISRASGNHSLTSNGATLHFFTTPENDFENMLERMIIDQDGKVGINITPTTYQFQVGGTAAGTSWTNVSDKRYKKKVANIESPVEKLLGLRGVTYYWDEKSGFDDGKKHYGFIAQEVQKVVPELVTSDGNGFLGVEYANVTSLLVEGFKSIYSSVQKLIAKMNLFEVEKEKQAREIASLKKENQILKNYLCQKDKNAPFCQK